MTEHANELLAKLRCSPLVEQIGLADSQACLNRQPVGLTGFEVRFAKAEIRPGPLEALGKLQLRCDQLAEQLKRVDDLGSFQLPRFRVDGAQGSPNRPRA